MKETTKETKTEAEVIDITEHIRKRKLKNAEAEKKLVEIGSDSDLSELIELMELATDDIAGTLIARHVYNVDLLPGIASSDLMSELKIRIIHHTTILRDLENELND